MVSCQLIQTMPHDILTRESLDSTSISEVAQRIKKPNNMIPYQTDFIITTKQSKIWPYLWNRLYKATNKQLLPRKTRKVWLHSSQGYPLLGNLLIFIWFYHFCVFHKTEMNMTNFGPFSHTLSWKCPETADLPVSLSSHGAKTRWVDGTPTTEVTPVTIW